MSQLFYLRYAELINLLNEFNKTLEKFTDDEPDFIKFSIVPETDRSIVWKLFIRIKCSRISKADGQIIEENIYSAKQFLSVYQSLTDQLSVLEENTSHTLINSSKTVSTATLTMDSIKDDYSTFAENQTITEQFYSFDDQPAAHSITTRPQISRSISVGKLSLPIFDNPECCVCMDHASDLILSCEHRLCEQCFQRWLNESETIGQQTCPICRCIVSIHGSFLLLEKPKTDDVKNAIKQSLFQLAKDNEKN